MATKTLVIFLMLLAMCRPSTCDISECGKCMCDRTTLTCDFSRAMRFYTRNELNNKQITLRELVPTRQEMLQLGLNNEDYEEFYVNCQSTPNVYHTNLTKDIVEGFVNVKYFSILRCRLNYIEPDLFKSMSRLQSLDLTDNMLTVLPDRIFSGLNLVSLKLSENPGLQLNEVTFEGLQLKQLSATRCDLKEFPLNALLAIRNLTEVGLTGNHIKFVPRSALALTKRLKKLYVDKNPLSCTCSNRWISEEVDWAKLSDVGKIAVSKIPKCKSPYNLMDIEVTKIDSSRFQCLPPRLTSLNLSVLQVKARISCSALISESNDRKLKWKMVQVLPLSKRPAALEGFSSGSTFSVTVDRPNGSDEAVWRLSAENYENQESNVTLRIHWPPRPPAVRPASTPRPSQVLLGSTKLMAAGQQPVDYFSQKQFTLVQMIIAVIGTFVITVAVLLLVYMFIKCDRKRDKKHWGIYDPQPCTHTYNFNQAPSSHEYDVPRVEHSMPTTLLANSTPSHAQGADYFDFVDPSQMHVSKP